MEKNSAKLPFLWGAATSSHQIEGYNDANNWWHWENQGNIEGGVRSGPATDHRNRFKQDICLAAELGLNTYRFSVEWSRIEPQEGQFENAALDWYRELILECEKYKLVPMMTLHHFTIPQWLAKKGGIANREFPKYFLRYARSVVEKVGERVPLWCTLNEPMVLVAGSYIGGFMPPAKFDPLSASHACRNLLKAHVLAYDLIHSQTKRKEGAARDYPLQVGIAHNLMDFMPERNWHVLEVLFTNILRRFYNKSWLDAVTGKEQHFGVAGLIPYAKQISLAHDRNTVDFIGVNYYTKAYVRWWPKYANPHLSSKIPVGIYHARHQEERSDMDWAIHPKGLRRILRFVSKYQLPIYITENGIADRDDSRRAEFLKSHLSEVATAITNGIDIRGYYHWSLLDNFEWIYGFGPRFGLYEVDYKTYERRPRKSALVYAKMIKAHRGEVEKT